MRMGMRLGAAGVVLSLGLLGAGMAAQQPDQAAVIRSIDAAVHARAEGVEGYLVIEHYAVFRGGDEVHPAAEMTVKTIYRKTTGKTYIIQSESGFGDSAQDGSAPDSGQ